MAPFPPCEAGVRRIYLVRHAQPVMPDGRRRFLGQIDPPLSAAGIEQAHRLAARFCKVPLHCAYSSDLERSRRTATILTAGRDLEIREKQWLREIDAGAFDLLTFEEARERHPEAYAAREQDMAGFPFPGGESLRDVEARVLPPFLSLVEGTTGDVLMVGHRAVNVVLLSHLMSRPLASAFKIPQEYCAVSVIETDLDIDGRRRFSVELHEDWGGRDEPERPTPNPA